MIRSCMNFWLAFEAWNPLPGAVSVETGGRIKVA